jgi:signal transduction histidine kinase
MNLRLGASRTLPLLAGLFVLGVLGAAAWLVTQFGSSAENLARQQAERLARANEVALNRSLLDIDLTLAGLVRLPGLFNAEGSLGDPVHVAKVLEALTHQGLLMRDLVVLGADGRLVAAADATTARHGLALPEGFLADVRSQAAPQLKVSAPATQFSTGDKVLYFARPLAMGSGHRWVVVAAVPVTALTALMAPAVDIDGLSIALENEQGVLLTSVPTNDALLGRRRPGPSGGAAAGVGWASAEGASLVADRLHGGPAYATSRPLVVGMLKVTAAISRAAVRANARPAQIASLTLAAAFIALGLAVLALGQVYLARLTRASAEASSARQALEEALASMDEGFLLWDAQDRVVTWNERYLALFAHLRGVIAPGVSLQEVAQAGMRGMLPEASDEQRQAWIRQRVAARANPSSSFEQRTADGRIVSSTERRTANGGIVSVYRDVTRERAAADELQRARQAAEAANEAKTRFLATMSHEIRTPLNGVLGMNGLLLATPLDARQRQYAETIRDSGETLLTIIGDVLDMSRLEAGRMALEIAPFDPAALLDQVAALLRTRAHAKAIDLQVTHDDTPPAGLHGDASRIRQVLYNLVGNAIKFTERGGVDVRGTHQVRADGRIDWSVLVRDTGIGIADKDLSALFDRFTQADDGISRRFGGSGLGLAISRELVHLMGGHIAVRSRLGEGSEFSFTLPLLPAPAGALTTTPPPLPGADVAGGCTGLRILVAEDNLVNQMLIQAMLERLGHLCDLVPNGREALRQLQQTPYDIVLMDIQMPELDGVSATQTIRQWPGELGRIPIIAVSANVLPEQRAAYLAAGMDDHVPKPVSEARLQAAIEGAARR